MRVRPASTRSKRDGCHTNLGVPGKNGGDATHFGVMHGVQASRATRTRKPCNWISKPDPQQDGREK
jgi:hypothetical protein